MEQYESTLDDTNSVIEGRICVFIYLDSVDEEGTFSNYQFADKITSEKAGFLFVIEQEEVDNLHHYKISYNSGKPMLVRREENAE